MDSFKANVRIFGGVGFLELVHAKLEISDSCRRERGGEVVRGQAPGCVWGAHGARYGLHGAAGASK